MEKGHARGRVLSFTPNAQSGRLLIGGIITYKRSKFAKSGKPPGSGKLNEPKGGSNARILVPHLIGRYSWLERSQAVNCRAANGYC